MTEDNYNFNGMDDSLIEFCKLINKKNKNESS